MRAWKSEGSSFARIGILDESWEELKEGKFFIDIYRAAYGYKCRMMGFEEFWEPWQTSYFQYPEVENTLLMEGWQWAMGEGIPFVWEGLVFWPTEIVVVDGALKFTS